MNIKVENGLISEGYYDLEMPRIDGFRGNTSDVQQERDWKSLISDFQDSLTFGAALDGLRSFCETTLGAEIVDSVSFWFDGCDILVGSRESLIPIIRNLQQINGLDIKAAPNVAGVVQGPEDYMALILEYGLDRATLLEEFGLNEIDVPQSVPQSIPEQAKKQFLEDIEALAENGLQHSFVTEGHQVWRWEPHSQRIVLTQWSSLEELTSPIYREHQRNRVEELLELI